MPFADTEARFDEDSEQYKWVLGGTVEVGFSALQGRRRPGGCAASINACPYTPWVEAGGDWALLPAPYVYVPHLPILLNQVCGAGPVDRGSLQDALGGGWIPQDDVHW